ncbi:hypothetical protein FXO38_25874 [Capsicum annuum]|uniref:Uncharacterized protein n=1 Tax=Capsicum annuum TaxID=4072 RepID=A0A2G2ZHQ1_CAPAN|nr:hypothetical protein FXO38_25874 [Capsicum annuum]PHT81520.1 hypothetical protein T459_14535 [Capsicum annuum]
MGQKGKLSGDIGGLIKLIYLDMSFNQGLTGSLSPRIEDLQKLTYIKISFETYITYMYVNASILHFRILTSCSFSGSIPRELGKLVELSFLNALNGCIPSNLNNLTSVVELNLAHNELSDPLLDLSGMNSLNYLNNLNNLCRKPRNNAFNGTLNRKPRNNAFNGTLNTGGISGRQFTLVDLQNNEISSITLGSGYKNALILIENLVCDKALGNRNYCQHQQ